MTSQNGLLCRYYQYIKSSISLDNNKQINTSKSIHLDTSWISLSIIFSTIGALCWCVDSQCWRRKHSSVKPAQVSGLQVQRDNVRCKNSILLDFHSFKIHLFRVSSLDLTIIRVKNKPWTVISIMSLKLSIKPKSNQILFGRLTAP